jgi:putative transposase
MDEKFNHKYRTSPHRLGTWDYGSHGLYYVTICTKDRLPYLGNIIDSENGAKIAATEIGSIATQNWLNIPQHFPFVELDEYVIMPNHIHGIIFINKPDKIDWNPNKFGSQSQNLASILRGYKASVKTYATINKVDFGWQAGFYDRVIRDEKEYQNIRQYIWNNPTQWLLNGDNLDNIYQ